MGEGESVGRSKGGKKLRDKLKTRRDSFSLLLPIFPPPSISFFGMLGIMSAVNEPVNLLIYRVLPKCDTGGGS